MCAAAVASIYDVHQLVDFYRLAYKAGWLLVIRPEVYISSLTLCFSFFISVGAALLPYLDLTFPLSLSLYFSIMFSSSRSLRGTIPPVTRYGFGEATSGAYPLVSGVPPAGVFGGSPTLKARDVSFDTSSKEPHLVRARVFVGNMNTNVITRDDIIRLFSAYGTLLGVTVFKGYAFIQYGTSTEADLAVSALNGYSWNGSILDVKLAIAGMKSHNVTSTVSTSNGVKRGAENFSGSSANAKKERLDDYGKTAAQNNRNRQTATTDSTESRNLYETGMPDTLICGGCRFVTSDFEEFREHRKSACPTNSVDGEVENEEMKWQCSMCDEVCASGGALIDHAFDRHNIRLLKSGTE